MNYFVYIAECSDGTLYTGYTTDIDNRIARHNAGKGAKYTRSRLPVRLLCSIHRETLREALQTERRIKKMSRAEKAQLIWEIDRDSVPPCLLKFVKNL